MARRKRRSPSRSSRSKAPGPSPSGWCVTQSAVEEALVSGERARELEELFGESEYRELVELARHAGARSRRGGRKVLILPGIMGSKLGVPNSFLLFDDVYWLDPVDVVLASSGTSPCRAAPSASSRWACS